jgi:hypothetical protein
MTWRKRAVDAGTHASTTGRGRVYGLARLSCADAQRIDQPFEIFPSLWGKCLRHTGQNFFISNFSDIVRLFFVVV